MERSLTEITCYLMSTLKSIDLLFLQCNMENVLLLLTELFLIFQKIYIVGLTQCIRLI